MSSGMFERFDENLENVENYIYRLKQFMLISKTKEDFKTPFLISCIGPKYFGILRNLVFPEEVDQVPFDNLCKILLKHFNPKTNIIYERFVFQKMDQKSGEAISKYIIRLKEQAQRCNFGDFLQESLRDRFVAGIIDTPTQKKLLQEEGLTFEGALDIALSAESADKDLHNLKRSEDAHRSPQHLHAINNPCKHCDNSGGMILESVIYFRICCKMENKLSEKLRFQSKELGEGGCTPAAGDGHVSREQVPKNGIRVGGRSESGTICGEWKTRRVASRSVDDPAGRYQNYGIGAAYKPQSSIGISKGHRLETIVALMESSKCNRSIPNFLSIALMIFSPGSPSILAFDKFFVTHPFRVLFLADVPSSSLSTSSDCFCAHVKQCVLRKAGGRPKVTTPSDYRYLALTAKRLRKMSAHRLSLEIATITDKIVP
ncbi:hypothetical protein LAZ67_5004301 [Cordylochernes scorpioides]|uniref:Retrotransposon gag domain-containing protein n=1 Tax=Cordylochernes scorpioides TaxID=51811 RepID=A0ABY6KI85_9ARAC|nr:hypothetical protein LAZ67_5004301 [Cordylochernes scorpioides]